MKYEIGQKVETPLGIGKIISISEIDDEYEAPEYNLLVSDCKNYYEIVGSIHD